MNIEIRDEKATDHSAIRSVTELAFAGKPYADGDEQDLIDTLRELGVLTVSLVALDDGDLIGQITFSPASISSGIGEWYALGPVSVHPERQGEGIGGKLIESGIAAIRDLGGWGCILTGDPKYYAMHKFRLAGEHCPSNEPRDYFMLRAIADQQPKGEFSFHEAFYADT